VRERLQVSNDLYQKQRHGREDRRQHRGCPEEVINDGSWALDPQCLGVVLRSGLMQETALK